MRRTITIAIITLLISSCAGMMGGSYNKDTSDSSNQTNSPMTSSRAASS